MYLDEYNRKGEVTKHRKVKSIGHFGIIRDYTLELKGGCEILISADIIEEIIKHEKLEIDTE